MAAKPAPKKATPRPKAAAGVTKHTQTTLVPSAWGKKSPAGNAKGKSKPMATANGNIMTFFKKAEELNNRIFLQERGSDPTLALEIDGDEDVGWTDDVSVIDTDTAEQRYNENGGSFKKRRVDDDESVTACSSPQPEPETEKEVTLKAPPTNAGVPSLRSGKKIGPFVDDSESEADEELMPPRRGTILRSQSSEGETSSKPSKESSYADNISQHSNAPPALKPEEISPIEEGNFDEFGDLEDDDLLEGEEYDERRWMAEQRKLEMSEAGFEGDPDDFDPPDLFPEKGMDDNQPVKTTGEAPSCPLCSTVLGGMSDQEVSAHVNACLDGNPLPAPPARSPTRESTPPSHKMFKRPIRPAKPGQDSPFKSGEESTAPKSAFSRLMANNAEDAAWATAAADQSASRGKPAYQRTCPFYKIMTGFYICVDAFRYGAVKGQNAYFLSHFHSDHYIGLTASWSHGPIYCSKVTGNLVRQQLRVDPKWVVDLEFEKKTEVQGTEGVHVTMIPANHCPGSSLFLFEKAMTKGPNPRLQRVLHCGDFRACQAHLEHPLLKPEVMDAVSGKNRQQKLDVCYLDTTYLNPKYAFPPQQQVIQACADMCVSLNKETVDVNDGFEKMKKERAGAGMVKFVQRATSSTSHDAEPNSISPSKKRGRLLVIVGTYSIGKERICIGIAKALDSKIYAPPAKQKICRALEDAELDALLTKNPREAQVHMTPLFEIRADTLDDYLRDYMDTFTRAVGFRPSGWNYRPPKNRFTESPSVSTVLHSQNWKSPFSIKDLAQQRGSTHRAKCFGVPYSEHSSFRELTMFCCALRIDRIIPTVNVGSAKSRELMKGWCEKWAVERRKNGLFKLDRDGGGW
ncbi:DRMBL-domain-containing protein [Massarina eburnea CBS 473.64]|uniref:DRMBL-domain-containing protein n=1 Tax=Massarina eburnea CBS 473.64 TaxID=1395130 RepID=A0A6A6RJI9_9PLEO|nr:DRMBL-domain-containing protein [Massarina eburnea CBS 473.64]